jgi:hypothetical protein
MWNTFSGVGDFTSYGSHYSVRKFEQLWIYSRMKYKTSVQWGCDEAR